MRDRFIPSCTEKQPRQLDIVFEFLNHSHRKLTLISRKNILLERSGSSLKGTCMGGARKGESIHFSVYICYSPNKSVC